jgi:prophage regulatory protein
MKQVKEKIMGRNKRDIAHIQPMAIAISYEEAADFVVLGLSTMEKLVRQGLFPQPRKVSAKRVVFLVRELTEWLESRPVSDILPPPNTGAPKPR